MFTKIKIYHSNLLFKSTVELFKLPILIQHILVFCCVVTPDIAASTDESIGWRENNIMYSLTSFNSLCKSLSSVYNSLLEGKEKRRGKNLMVLSMAGIALWLGLGSMGKYSHILDRQMVKFSCMLKVNFPSITYVRGLIVGCVVSDDFCSGFLFGFVYTQND